MLMLQSAATVNLKPAFFSCNDVMCSQHALYICLATPPFLLQPTALQHHCDSVVNL